MDAVSCQMRNKLFSVIYLILDKQRKPKDYGTGQMLYHSEVKLLDAVYSNTGVNSSELAEYLGITKGAVTQATGKLVDKGLIEFYLLCGNKKEKHFRLTELGEAARQGHIAFHKDTNRWLCEYFCSLGTKEREVILEFLDKLHECVPFCEYTFCEYSMQNKKSIGKGDRT